MNRVRLVHLLDDVSFGGVTRALAIFDDPRLASQISSRTVQVDPHRLGAPGIAADMVLIHFTPRWRALPFLLALKLRNPRIRIVHVEHSYTRSWAAHHVGNPQRFAAMLRLWYGLCDDVVAVSHGQAAWLRQFVRSVRSLRVISPWSGEQNLGDVAPRVRREGAPVRLAAFGRFAPQKGFDTLMRAMALLPSERFTLDLGGFGPDEPLLRRLADNAGLAEGRNPQVRFVGKVDDVAAFVAEADVVVVPSRWEAFGQVVAEAMLAGRPVLVSDVDGMPEQLPDPSWVADCATPERLARAIRAICPASLAKVGVANRDAMAGAAAARIAQWLDLVIERKPHQESGTSAGACAVSSRAGVGHASTT